MGAGELLIGGDMTDEEINKRVAEIDGWATDPSPTGRFVWMKHPEHGIPPGRHSGNDVAPPYATDWTWCGPLLTKLLSKGNWGLEYWHGGEYVRLNYEKETTSKADTPQRAICLAVIAAHS